MASSSLAALENYRSGDPAANRTVDSDDKLALCLAMRRLPPLAAVRVFEATARHENFTAAADELGMTQAAVSYHIRLLEERLGIPLFRRERRRVVLTDAGRRVAPRISAAFDAIDGAFAQLRAEDETMLTISATHTFIGTWLAWRIGGFQVANSDMAVKLRGEDGLIDFARDEVDVAVRSGRGPWPGLAADLLLTVDFTPMCSPGFLARHGGALTATQLLDLPLITADDPWWPDWLADEGIALPAHPIHSGVRMDSQANRGSAAMAGQGVALLTPFFWRNDLAEGRLVRPFERVSSRGYGYWLVVPEHRRAVAKIKRFREWLLAEIGRPGP